MSAVSTDLFEFIMRKWLYVMVHLEVMCELVGERRGENITSYETLRDKKSSSRKAAPPSMPESAAALGQPMLDDFEIQRHLQIARA